MLKPILILIKANLKQQSKHKAVMIGNILPPIMYAIVLPTQILLMYHINEHAFKDLPIRLFFVCFYALQIVVFISYDQSVRGVARAVLTGQFDHLLLRPVNLFVIKHFQRFDFMMPVMSVFYFFGFTIASLLARITIGTYMHILLFVICASVIKLNLKTAMRGLIFFYRDILNSTALEESLDMLAINKPPEVFPSVLKVIFTFVIPYMFVHNFAYSLIRGYLGHEFWFAVLLWMIISITLNNTIWLLGIKHYESI
jgi:ABC-type uncharacterized transport system permease subunit